MVRNVLIIAGYDALANEILVHRNYVRACLNRAHKEEVNLIVLIGGATNPDYPFFTEASANFAILKKEFPQNRIEIKLVDKGNTAAEALTYAKIVIEKFKDGPFCRIVLCAEQSRLPSFIMDALQIGLLDLFAEVVAHGYYFPESKDNFNSERKKMLLKVLSHRSKLFKFVRNIIQGFHQRKVARQKRKNTV
ncbi:MAG: hypothetical protein ABIC36_03375 [bacterium]